MTSFSFLTTSTFSSFISGMSSLSTILGAGSMDLLLDAIGSMGGNSGVPLELPMLDLLDLGLLAGLDSLVISSNFFSNDSNSICTV